MKFQNSIISPPYFVPLYIRTIEAKYELIWEIFRGSTIKLKFNIGEYGRLTLLNLWKCITVNICPRKTLGTLRAWKPANSMFLNQFVHIWTLSLIVIIDRICHTFIPLVLYCSDKVNCKFFGMVSINDNFQCWFLSLPLTNEGNLILKSTLKVFYGHHAEKLANQLNHCTIGLTERMYDESDHWLPSKTESICAQTGSRTCC